MNLKKGYIYRYKYNDQEPLCIYMCDTQAKNRILVVPLTDKSDGNVYKLSITKQYANLDNYKEINTDNITNVLYLSSKPVRVPDPDLHAIQHFILNDIMEKICTDVHSNNISHQFFEALYQFLKWKWQKLLLNTNKFQRKTKVYENGLYWASLGINVGSELNKSRPVLVWKKRCNGENEENYSYIVIPITSKDKSKKYYMNIPIDINGRPCYLRIEDMRRINIKRFTRPILNDNKKILFIDNNKRDEIIDAIKKFYIFENQHKTT